MLKALKVVLIILAVLTAIIVSVGIKFNYGMGAIKKLTIENLDLQNTENGVYKGEYKKGRWAYSLLVGVTNGEIKSITILNTNEAGVYGTLNDDIIATILKEQSLKIDTVSGASISTKALLKAVENALTK